MRSCSTNPSPLIAVRGHPPPHPGKTASHTLSPRPKPPLPHVKPPPPLRVRKYSKTDVRNIHTLISQIVCRKYSKCIWVMTRTNRHGGQTNPEKDLYNIPAVYSASQQNTVHIVQCTIHPPLYSRGALCRSMSHYFNVPNINVLHINSFNQESWCLEHSSAFLCSTDQLLYTTTYTVIKKTERKKR